MFFGFMAKNPIQSINSFGFMRTFVVGRAPRFGTFSTLATSAASRRSIIDGAGNDEGANQSRLFVGRTAAQRSVNNLAGSLQPTEHMVKKGRIGRIFGGAVDVDIPVGGAHFAASINALMSETRQAVVFGESLTPAG